MDFIDMTDDCKFKSLSLSCACTRAYVPMGPMGVSWYAIFICRKF